jgi:hypothetical protein
MYEEVEPWPSELPRRRDGDRAWPKQASAWLATVAPSYLAQDPDLVPHPALLCSLTRHHVAGQLQGCRETWSRMRAEMSEDKVLPEVAGRILAATEAEGRRLAELEQQLLAVRGELAIANWSTIPYKKRSGGR